jgi:hypothetical protein
MWQTRIAVVRRATYGGSWASAASAVVASTSHQIRCSPKSQAPMVVAWRSGDSKPLNDANTTPHSLAVWICTRTKRGTVGSIAHRRGADIRAIPWHRGVDRR